MNISDLAALSAPVGATAARDPLTLVLLGATGDLTLRKLMPALYAMSVHRLLPDAFAIVGFARREYAEDAFREFLAGGIRAFARVAVDEERLRDFLRRVFYHRADLEGPEGYSALRERLADERAFPRNRLFYLSIKPELFGPVIARLRETGLVRPARDPAWSRVVIEKPFGRDLASALALNREVLRHLAESQVYRIDHFLGKETVQNTLSFRFANAIFEPLFNRALVDRIEITAAETVGMESGRGAYYDASGALRDMVQNHLLQILCLIAMEPPSGLTADAIRNEKVKVLQAIVPPAPGEVARCACRGQYGPGAVGGKPAPGYLEEERIAPGSRTETYAALRLRVDNWRWAGVPVLLRTGKRMARRATEVLVRFKSPPLQLFQTVQCVGDVCDLAGARPNQLVFRIQPDEGIALEFSAKRPAMHVQVENVAMNFSYAQRWPRSLPEAYERLLMDVMRGDSTLFMRSDEVEAAWRIVNPVLEAWAGDSALPLHTYPAGSWGPEAADRLVGDAAEGWHEPEATPASG